MCEERNLQNKKDSGVRIGRVQNIRQRMRAPRRVRSSEPCSSDSETEYMAPLPASPTPGARVSNREFISSVSDNMDRPPMEADDSWRKYRTYQQNNRDHLIEIAMRTVMLMRQNQQLQHKLAALKADTKVYMQSINNPPNMRPNVRVPDVQREVKVEPVEMPVNRE